MRIYTYSEARQQLAKLLDEARRGEVLIRRRDGATFSLAQKQLPASPLDVPGINTFARTPDILEAIRESRAPKQ